MRNVFHLRIAILLFFFISLANVSFCQVLNDESYKFMRVLNYISKYYVDSTNQNALVEDAIIKMLQTLDPHSVYISEDEVKEMNEPLQGSFDGIGVQFNILNDTIIVVMPISGGPSEKVGIRAGDRIVRIENENVAGVGIKNSGVRKYLLGEKDTKVNISVKRKGFTSFLDFTITRDEIPIYSIDASYKVNKNTGYIKLNKFAATTLAEFKQAFNELEADGMKNLILDLRGNGGGYLKTSIDIANEFLSKDKLIVYTEGENSPKEEYLSYTNGMFEKGKLVLIIDEGSASASEILSGAIQDWDRGIIVGRRSFGKGLVQRPFYLPDGSMIRLTTARYFTPTGRLIQKSYDEGVSEYKKDLVNRYSNGELLNKDSNHFIKGEKFSTLKNNRFVYGGGGIMPDIFVPIDTSGNTDYFDKLVRKGIINLFALDYIDKNRKYIEQTFTKFEYFNSDFVVSDKMLENLTFFAKREAVDLNVAQFEISKSNIRNLVKATIALNVWGTSEYFQIINQESPAFIKAVEVIEDKDLYSQKLNSK